MQADYYKTLQLHPECDQDIIPRMRKLLSQLFHPDIAPKNRQAEFTVIMQRINDAADKLSFPELRKEYNSRHPYFTMVRYAAGSPGDRSHDHEDFQDSRAGGYSHADDVPSSLRKYLAADLLYSVAKKARELNLLDPFTRRAFYNLAKRIENGLRFSPWQIKNFQRLVEMAIEAGILGARA
ncbi:MAG: DnaJ domain-containing protein [Victivallales bacterium]|nr:DnaJ domain-containing protein [Victivallales bacterium]